MDNVFQVAALIALIASCAGFGAAVLRLSGAHLVVRNGAETCGVGFVLGMGVLGWVLFFLGIAGAFSPQAFWPVTGFGIILLAVNTGIYRRAAVAPAAVTREYPPKVIALLGLLAVVLAFDLLEGISPPADADTLASHFAVPKQFLLAGRIEFVPRAVTGAIPMLLHMTYAAALGIGGEITLTLWAMVTGWAAGLLVYGVARRFADRAGALALAIVFLTTPAVLYGGGSGQVETPCAAIVLASAIVLVAGRESGSWRTIAVAGMLAGFFVGAKYFGLIFAGSAGLVLLFHRRGIRFAFVFGVAVIVAGAQWYTWNWWHSGDPVFPSLFRALGLPDTAFWTAAYGEYHSTVYAAAENPLARTVVNWLLYPVYATFDMVPKLESGRTGLGVLLFLLLPLTVAGAFRKQFRDRETIILFALAAIFFTVWFASGTSQRVRHLLPIYPLLLVSCCALALKAAEKYALMRPFSVAVILVLIVQIGGHGLFASNYAKHVFSNETRREFQERNVRGANAVFWINETLSPRDRVAYTPRGIAYLFAIPYFMLHPLSQAVVDFRPASDDGGKFIARATKLGINHFLLDENWHRKDSENAIGSVRMMAALIASGCLKKIKAFPVTGMSSRTLAQVGGNTGSSTAALFRLQPEYCPAESADTPGTGAAAPRT